MCSAVYAVVKGALLGLPNETSTIFVRPKFCEVDLCDGQLRGRNLRQGPLALSIAEAQCAAEMVCISVRR